ncbi:MAG: alpha-L-rhamnosidase N-terminal domain-containing protein, partial [Chloroflexota bacterium]
MTSPFATATWISSPHPFDLHEVYLDFLSPPFDGRAGKSVEIFISADARYRLWLNGEFVARGPVRSYPQRQGYDRIDVSRMLRPNGKNVLAAQVYQPGYSHFSYVHRGAVGLLVDVHLDGTTILASDSSWKVRRSPTFGNPYFNGIVSRVSIYGANTENQLIQSKDEWQLGEQSSFKVPMENARIVAPPEGYIWSNLHERITPMSTERDLEATLIESRLITQDIGMKGFPHEEVRLGWQLGQKTSFAEEDGWIFPRLQDGATAIWLYDLGRSYTCQGWFEVQGIQNSSDFVTISITYAEKQVDSELIISNPATYCRVQLTDSFTFAPPAEDQAVVPFNLRGGRYILFRVSGALDDDFKIRIHTRVAEYPLEITKPLDTGDPQLNAISSLCESTFKACLQDSFVDCVWRESSQWVGDGLIQGLIMSSMTDDLRPVRKLLLDAAAGQYPDGLLPSVAPAEVHAYTIPRYTCMWI